MSRAGQRALAAIAAGWMLSAASAAAATYYVDGANPLASDSNAGTAAAPYKTISAAVTARGAAGTTILVKPAIYRETLTPGASGAAGNPFVIRATGPNTVIDGADDYAVASKWTLVSGAVYLASSVKAAPNQVFADGTRLSASTASPASMPARTFRWVSGTGLYVNAGGGSPATHAVAVGARTYGVRISGRTWVTVAGFLVTRTEDRAVYLSSSANNVGLARNTVTFAYKYGIYIAGCTTVNVDSNLVTDNADHGIYLNSGAAGCFVRANESARNVRTDLSAANGIYVNASTGNRLERNRVHDNSGSGVMIYGTSTSTLSLYDQAWANGDQGVRVSGSTGVRLLGDVARANGQRGIALEGASTGATIANCIATDNGLATAGFDFAVQSGAQSGLASDYNLWWNSTAQAPFQYGSTTYATLAAFRTASGKDAHSGQLDPRFVDGAHADFHLLPGSPAIDAANAAPADWPVTDADGHARVDDPLTPNTGAGTPGYADRGAYEYQRLLSPPVAALKATPAFGDGPLAVTLDASGTTDADGGSLTYQFDYGDGVGSLAQSAPTSQHVYGPGTWTAKVTVTDNTAFTGTAITLVTVTVHNAVPVPVLGVRFKAAGAITRGDTVLAIPVVVRPPYFTPQPEPTFGGPMRRITGDAGTTFPLPNGGTGTWGTDARHHYSKDQPWSADGSLISIDNNGGSPIELFLDGRTYAVARGRCPNYISGDDRWHPSPAHAHERINVVGNQLMWFDVVSCVKTRSWTLPFAVNGIGPSEGNPSDDGRFVALTDSARVFVVDMDPQPPLQAYPAQRIGPAIDVSNCGLADGCQVGWVSMSASGKYVVVKYMNDHPRVYDVNPNTLALTPHVMPASAVICSGGDPAQGWIYDLGHPDLALDPYDDDEDVIVGQEHCGLHDTVVNGQVMGGVAMVRLRDGYVTSVTDPQNEAHPHHISARNLRRPGWVYVDYFPTPGARYDDEVVAVKIDGSHTVQRLAHKHTLWVNCYRCESHAVPSLDGRRVIWASNWDDHCLACGPTTDIRAYVVDASNAFVPDTTALTTAVLDAGASRDSDGTIASYRFFYGDGGISPTQPVSLVTRDYRPGTWRTSVTVTDNLGARDSSVASLVVPRANRPPNGTIVSPAIDVTIAVGQSLTLTGAASDPDGNLPVSCLWNLGGAGPNYRAISPGTVAFTRTGRFVVTLLATDALGLDDPTPDSVVVIVTPSNGRPPIVTAPLTVKANELQALSFDVSAVDPDGQPIASLTANLAGLPVGNTATFTPNATNTAGTFRWTPSSTAGGGAGYSVTFTAANDLSGSGATHIDVADVSGPDLMPNGSFESSTAGWGPNGAATLSRTFTGQDGKWSMLVTGSTAPGMFGANDSPNAILATLGAGIRYRYTAWVRSVTNTGHARLRVREYDHGVQVGTIAYSLPLTLSPTWQSLTLDFVCSVGGSTLDFQVLDDPLVPNESFQADNISTVIIPNVGQGVLSVADSIQAPVALGRAMLAPSIVPHPVSGTSIIRFSTTRRGPVELTLHDLAGRAVRTLIHDPNAAAGAHQVAMRNSLPAGIYFWKLSTPDLRTTGRMVILN